MKKEYSVDDFIDFFERIPEEQWCIGRYGNLRGQHCALGHCGNCVDNTGHSIYSTMGDALTKLVFIELGLGVTCVNDFNHYIQGDTPRQRILNALYKIKSKQLPTPPALVLAPAWPMVAMQVKPVEVNGSQLIRHV